MENNAYRPLTAAEYKLLADELGEQQRMLAERQVTLKQRVSHHVVPGAATVVQLMIAAMNCKEHEQVVATYDGSDTPRSHVAYCGAEAPSLVIENIAHLPTRIRFLPVPGGPVSISSQWRQIQDTGCYPTVEEHLANKTPLHTDVNKLGVV